MESLPKGAAPLCSVFPTPSVVWPLADEASSAGTKGRRSTRAGTTTSIGKPAGGKEISPATPRQRQNGAALPLRSNGSCGGGPIAAEARSELLVHPRGLRGESDQRPRGSSKRHPPRGQCGAAGALANVKPRYQNSPGRHNGRRLPSRYQNDTGAVHVPEAVLDVAVGLLIHETNTQIGCSTSRTDMLHEMRQLMREPQRVANERLHADTTHSPTANVGSKMTPFRGNTAIEKRSKLANTMCFR